MKSVHFLLILSYPMCGTWEPWEKACELSEGDTIDTIDTLIVLKLPSFSLRRNETWVTRSISGTYLVSLDYIHMKLQMSLFNVTSWVSYSFGKFQSCRLRPTHEGPSETTTNRETDALGGSQVRCLQRSVFGSSALSIMLRMQKIGQRMTCWDDLNVHI